MLRRDAYDSVIYLHPSTLSTPQKKSVTHQKGPPTPNTFTVSTLTYTLEAKRDPTPWVLTGHMFQQLVPLPPLESDLFNEKYPAPRRWRLDEEQLRVHQS